MGAIMADHFIRLHELDNVVIALADLPAGVDLGFAILPAAVPRGHKIATMALAQGARVGQEPRRSRRCEIRGLS